MPKHAQPFTIQELLDRGQIDYATIVINRCVRALAGGITPIVSANFWLQRDSKYHVCGWQR